MRGLCDLCSEATGCTDHESVVAVSEAVQEPRMPFYRAHVRPDLLDLAGRSAFSNDVVEVHCGVTGAPPSFVHVMITEDSGSLPEGQNSRISSTIQAGRTDEQKPEMQERLSALLAQRSGVDATTISATSSDIEASFTMEGGALLPEPGSVEEAAWKAAG